MKYTSRAALLRDAADSIEMQEKAGIEPVFICDGSRYGIVESLTVDDADFDCEFPLTVVEGKPVFVGDELYAACGNPFKVISIPKGVSLRDCSWNPPKPRTVMVELPVTVAESYSKDQYGMLSSACRKALEELK